MNVSSGDHAVFNCTAITTFINWEVNGGPIDSNLISRGFDQGPLVTLNVSQNLRTISLIVLGSADSNNASIVCVATELVQIQHLQLSDIEFVGNTSNPALLLVQGTALILCYSNNYVPHAGLLEQVTNLVVVSINSTTVLISWSPPFTLEGVPILGYNVTVTNTTSGENETMSVEGDTTMLYYSIDHPDPDNTFTVTVVPINGAGPGEDVTKQFLFSFGELNHNCCYSYTRDGAKHF